MANQVIHKDVCIVGGGPAGMILGLMLAKAGVEVMVLESHSNFDREYRGEVLQPRFTQLMDQLGLREYIESFPSSKIKKGSFYYKNKRLGEFSFTNIAPDIPYALWMPQPILLQALYDKGRELPAFEMRFHAAVKQLIREESTVAGVVAEGAGGERIEVRARVTIGADGRYSAVSKLGGFQMEYEHQGGDLIWFTIPRPDGWEDELRLKVSDGHGYILLPKYPNHMQVGVAVPPGEWKEIRQHGIESFREELVASNEVFSSFAQSLTDFKPFVLLQATDFYVAQWAQDGCLLIGDAAHCASPIGAVGVSLSVTTAVIAADVIYDALQDGDVSAARLSQVQKLRNKEVRQVHKLQERAAKVLFTSSPFIRTIAPLFITLAAKTRLLTLVQRNLLMLSEPVPVNTLFVFTKDVD